MGLLLLLLLLAAAAATAAAATCCCRYLLLLLAAVAAATIDGSTGWSQGLQGTWAALPSKSLHELRLGGLPGGIELAEHRARVLVGYVCVEGGIVRQRSVPAQRGMGQEPEMPRSPPSLAGEMGAVQLKGEPLGWWGVWVGVGGGDTQRYRVPA